MDPAAVAAEAAATATAADAVDGEETSTVAAEQQLNAVRQRKRELLRQLRRLDEEETRLLSRQIKAADAAAAVPPTAAAAAAPSAAAATAYAANELTVSSAPPRCSSGAADEIAAAFVASSHNLTSAEVERYSRQILLPAFGPEAQQRLRNSSVLVIGAGGLGSPAALYLAAAGVGTLGIVDRDDVELSNLHRQIIHTESRVGMAKVESAFFACKAVNSHVEVVMHGDGFTPSNAVAIAKHYDVIVDASDNVSTRYLISDAAVVTNKPLVFGAALGTEGQVTVYHMGDDGPCYRCLFPVPPPPSSCQRCSDSGVLGVVPGVIGMLQAVEAIKIAADVGSPLSSRMLHYDALAARFIQVKLRGRNPSCVACGDQPTITAQSLSQVPYESFTSSPFHDKGPSQLNLLPPSQRVGVLELATRLGRNPVAVPQTQRVDGNGGTEAACAERETAAAPAPAITASVAEVAAAAAAAATAAGNDVTAGDEAGRIGVVLLDVRPRHIFNVAALPSAINIPLPELSENLPSLWAAMRWSPAAESNAGAAASGTSTAEAAATSTVAAEPVSEPAALLRPTADPAPASPPTLYVVCRRGNDSQRAVQLLQGRGVTSAVSVDGGMHAWSRTVDDRFPVL